MTPALAVVLVLGLGALWWEAQPRLSPDGSYYAKGRRAPRPYGARLMSWVMPADLRWWMAVSGVSVALTALAVGLQGGWVAAALWLGLASTRTNTWFPGLTDQAGQLLLVGALWLPAPWNVVAALLGGCVNEKVPVLGAALALNPWLLVGLLPWGVAYALAPSPGAGEPEWLKHPWREARKASVHLDITVLLLPWGVALPGLLTIPAVAVLLSYGQLMVAQDRARLYQWVGAPVCVGAAALMAAWVPEVWWLPLVVVHWLLPWRKVL